MQDFLMFSDYVAMGCAIVLLLIVVIFVTSKREQLILRIVTSVVGLCALIVLVISMVYPYDLESRNREPDNERVEMLEPVYEDVVADSAEVTGTPGMEIYKVSRKSTYLVHKYTDSETGEFDQTSCMDDEDFLNEKIFPHTFETRDGEAVHSFIITEKDPFLTSHDILRAQADVRCQIGIQVTLTHEGGKKNEEFTSRLTKGIDRVAIIVDGRCISAPTQQADKLSRDFVITGLRDLKESREVAAKMMKK